MKPENLLSSFIEEIQIALPIYKREGEVYELILNDIDHVICRELEKGISLFAHVTPLSVEKTQEALLIYLMQANFLGQGTGKSSLGIDQSEMYVTLTLAMPFEATVSTFKEGLEDFVNYLTFWRAEIIRFQKSLFR